MVTLPWIGEQARTDDGLGSGQGEAGRVGRRIGGGLLIPPQQEREKSRSGCPAEEGKGGVPSNSS